MSTLDALRREYTVEELRFHFGQGTMDYDFARVARECRPEIEDRNLQVWTGYELATDSPYLDAKPEPEHDGAPVSLVEITNEEV